MDGLKLREYQEEAADFIYEHDRSIILAPVGAGKTALTLTAMQDYMDDFLVARWLVVAPKRVAVEVWPREVKKWSTLSLEVAVGSPVERSKVISGRAQVVVINYDNLQWLASAYPNLSKVFDGVVFDELTKLKNPSGKRFKAFVEVIKDIEIRIGLTGSFTSNGLEDVFGQVKIVDQSVLGRSKGAFMQQYFWCANPQFQEFIPRPGALKQIMERIKPVTYLLENPEYKDTLPPLHEVVLPCSMDLTDYKRMKRDLFLDLGGNAQIIAANAGVVTAKLQQMAGGWVYETDSVALPTPGKFKTLQTAHWLSDHKMEALDDLLEENQHAPTLVWYWYKEELAELKRRYPHAQTLDDKDAVDRWNNGQIELLLCHPQCLHPSTEVLTEHRGWVSIASVLPTDRVHDGVEFVQHKGSVCSGVKPVINRFGIWMTENHRILIDGVWVEAKDVRNSERVRRKACYGRTCVVVGGSEVSFVRSNIRDVEAERSAGEQGTTPAMPIVQKSERASHDKYKVLAYLERNARTYYTNAIEGLSSLWRCWSRRVVGMAKFQKFYAGYVPNIRGWFDIRAHRQLFGLFTRELSMGYEYGTAGEQDKHAAIAVRGRDYPSGRVMPKDGYRPGRYYPAIELRDDSRASGRGLSSIDISEKQKVSEVFDLVDCGPRHRFLIRNALGDIFVSHNSAGHGINLQGQNKMVFLTLPWSLELFEQAIGRLHRSGQAHEVWCYLLLTDGTIDELIYQALKDKKSLSEIAVACLTG